VKHDSSQFRDLKPMTFHVRYYFQFFLAGLQKGCLCVEETTNEKKKKKKKKCGKNEEKAREGKGREKERRDREGKVRRGEDQNNGGRKPLQLANGRDQG